MNDFAESNTPPRNTLNVAKVMATTKVKKGLSIKGLLRYAAPTAVAVIVVFASLFASGVLGSNDAHHGNDPSPLCIPNVVMSNDAYTEEQLSVSYVDYSKELKIPYFDTANGTVNSVMIASGKRTNSTELFQSQVVIDNSIVDMVVSFDNSYEFGANKTTSLMNGNPITNYKYVQNADITQVKVYLVNNGFDKKVYEVDFLYKGTQCILKITSSVAIDPYSYLDKLVF